MQKIKQQSFKKLKLKQEHFFFIILNTENALEEFPGGPVISTRYFHCSGLSFNPWLGN